VVDSYYDDEWDCTESSVESAEELTSGTTYDALADACRSCTYFYQVDVSPDEVCGWLGLSNPAYRGLILDGDQAELYTFYEDRDGIYASPIDDRADFDGWTVSYVYEDQGDSSYSLAISGSFTFPPLP
jgi:hypothetical protein